MEADTERTVNCVVITLSQPLYASKVSIYVPVESYMLLATVIDNPLQIVSTIEVYVFVVLSQTHEL